ncbi:unnamed protein product [Ilex paraguariensis]|uniref:Uncharacterized protein n=1 Tax=Ilex paraguariensis TaxID=185542 RepID=A0ABC8TTL0_9AQUA
MESSERGYLDTGDAGFLFRKEINLLILCFSLSSRNWNPRMDNWFRPVLMTVINGGTVWDSTTQPDNPNFGGEAKKRKKVVAMGSFGNAKLFVDKDVKKRVEFQQNDSFIYPMNAMGMGTLNKSVGAILGVKWAKCVKQPSAVA